MLITEGFNMGLPTMITLATLAIKLHLANQRVEELELEKSGNASKAIQTIEELEKAGIITLPKTSDIAAISVSE